MKLETQSMPVQEPAIKEDANAIALPLGLVGFPEMTQSEIVFSEDELPFMRLRNVGESSLHFLVVEPTGIIPGYQVEVMDQDLEYLGIKEAEDVMILNIATVAQQQPLKITVNLAGPIVINRKTQVGKQVIIGNYDDFSATHVLFEEPQND